MENKKRILNHKMRTIVLVIHRQGGAMSPNEISRETGISYVTVQKYLGELLTLEVLKIVDGEKMVKKKTRGQTIRYSLDYDLINPVKRFVEKNVQVIK